MSLFFWLHVFSMLFKGQFTLSTSCVCDVNFVIVHVCEGWDALPVDICAHQPHLCQKKSELAPYIIHQRYVTFISTSLTLFLWSGYTCCLIFTFPCRSVKYNKQRSASSPSSYCSEFPSCFVVHVCETCLCTHPLSHRSIFPKIFL